MRNFNLWCTIMFPPPSHQCRTGTLYMNYSSLHFQFTLRLTIFFHCCTWLFALHVKRNICGYETEICLKAIAHTCLTMSIWFILQGSFLFLVFYECFFIKPVFINCLSKYTWKDMTDIKTHRTSFQTPCTLVCNFVFTCFKTQDPYMYTNCISYTAFWVMPIQSVTSFETGFYMLGLQVKCMLYKLLSL